MKITVQDYRRTQTKHRKAKKGHGWTKLERIKMDCIWVNLKNVGPPFFKFMSVYIKISFTQRENHSQLLCGLDFANERFLLCQFAPKSFFRLRRLERVFSCTRTRNLHTPSLRCTRQRNESKSEREE